MTARVGPPLLVLGSLAVGVGAGFLLKSSQTTTRTTTVPASQPAGGSSGSKAQPGVTQRGARPAAGAGRGSNLSFNGTGPRTLGTVNVTRSGTLAWTNGGGHFEIRFAKGETAVKSAARSGRVFVPAGSYRHVRILATGHWTLRAR
jgi:hypothetical protein